MSELYLIIMKDKGWQLPDEKDYDGDFFGEYGKAIGKAYRECLEFWKIIDEQRALLKYLDIDVPERDDNQSPHEYLDYLKRLVEIDVILRGLMWMAARIAIDNGKNIPEGLRYNLRGVEEMEKIQEIKEHKEFQRLKKRYYKALKVPLERLNDYTDQFMKEAQKIAKTHKSEDRFFYEVVEDMLKS